MSETQPEAESTSRAAAAYRERRERWDAELARAERMLGRLGAARLVAFFAAAAIAVTAGPGWPWALLPAGVFVALVYVHGRAAEARTRAHRAVDDYTRLQDRAAGRWSGVGDDGARFLPRDHAYAADLDLFGESSLYQRVALTRTPLGARTLATMLITRASAEEAHARQAAVAELRDDLDLREELALLGDRVGAGFDPAALAAWAAAGPVLDRPYERAVAWGLAGLAVATSALWVATSVIWPLGIVALVEIGFGRVVASRLARLEREVEPIGRELGLLGELLAVFERCTFTAPALAAEAARLRVDGEPASARIERLARLLRRREQGRHNAFYGVASFLLQLPVHVGYGIERWRAHTGPSIDGWLDAAGRLEALCSVASYAFEREQDAIPEIVDDGARLEARALGHPLLPDERCVRNDVTLGAEPALMLVSGSNMSGKSTLLRAVGVNAVLAQIGAPVRADSLTVSPFAIGASIRVQDSLHEGESHFYAEVKRLALVDALTRGPVPVLFLLDEILHGTNSRDRLVGAKAVVHKLVDSGAVGMVTTHDLAVTALADELGARAVNVHFRDVLEDGRMRFDYVMRAGVVERGNALELMRSLGLEV